jgi:hypothetical protein
MVNNLRSLSYVILFASLSAVTALGVIGFLNNAYADNANMTANVKTNATVTASTNMTGKMNATMNTGTNMTGKMNATMNTGTNMTGNMSKNMTMTNIPKILSPLQQVKSGVPAKSVQCNNGFTLIIKKEDSSPACVSSLIAQALTVRGWGTAP